MMILTVDDEQSALNILNRAVMEAKPDAQLYSFSDADELLRSVERKEISPDVVLMDIEMPEINGLELGRRLKTLCPAVNMIFVTGFSQYALDAYTLYPSGYLMKPVTKEAVLEQLENLRNPVSHQTDKRVRIHCFGNFEVYLDGAPVEFQYSKTRELLAYLVDRQGVLCANNELIAVLWEDAVKESYFKKLRTDLFSSLPSELFVRQWGKLGILPDQLDCDYYEWMKGTPSAINAYTGEYMTQYSWSELTLGRIKA